MKRQVKCPTCGASIWLYSLGTHLVEKHGFCQVEQYDSDRNRWYTIKVWLRNKED